MVIRVVRLAVLVILLGMTGREAQAQSAGPTKKSILNLTDVTEVPGTVLEPGLYVFRLTESDGRRSRVEVLNLDESQIFTTVTAVPDRRGRPESDQFISYYEVVEQGPRPIRSWYHPGSRTGLEFVYPKFRARELAKASGDTVPASEPKQGAIVAVTPSGVEVRIDTSRQR
jgi:hypothetical protein